MKTLEEALEKVYLPGGAGNLERAVVLANEHLTQYGFFEELMSHQGANKKAREVALMSMVYISMSPGDVTEGIKDMLLTSLYYGICVGIEMSKPDESELERIWREVGDVGV